MIVFKRYGLIWLKIFLQTNLKSTIVCFFKQV